jgi:hypothetical protein
MRLELTGPSAFADLTDLHILGLSPSALDGALLKLTTSNQRVLHLLGTLCTNYPTCIPFVHASSFSPSCVAPTMSQHHFRTRDGVIDINFRISCFVVYFVGTAASTRQEAELWIHHLTQASQEIPFVRHLPSTLPLASTLPRAAVASQDDWSFLQMDTFVFGQPGAAITTKYT